MRLPQQPQGSGVRRESPAYREMLADKIAEAIVEERYGSGVYNAPARATAAADLADAAGTPASGGAAAR